MMLLRSTALIVMCIFSAALIADTDLRPVTHEDVWLMKRLGTPVVSPDGKKAVVAVTEPSYDKEETIRDLWLIDVAGKTPPRRLTATKAGESDVDWSPDGRKIAFSAKRGEEEVSQVYVLAMDGPGEAVRVTGLSTGATHPKWSPDGSRIAFESRVYPGAADDAANAEEKKAREEEKVNVSAYEIFPIRQWDKWRDDLRTHLFVQEAQPGAEAVDLMHDSELVAARGYSPAISAGSESLQAAWTPEGDALLITATKDLDKASRARVRYQLYRVGVMGNDVRPLTEMEGFSCTGAVFSEKGDALYCDVSPISDVLYQLPEVGRFDWSDGQTSGAISIVTEALDRPPTSFDVSDNGRELFLTAYDAGRARIHSLPAKGGKARLLDEDSRGVYSGIRVADGGLVARWASSDTPAEIVRINPRNGNHVALTSFNTERAAQLDRPPFRGFWFEAEDGRRVHSWLALPPDFDESKQYPLVLFIHGGPFSSSLDQDHVRWSPHLLAAPGYVVLLTDYKGSVGYGEAFSQAIEGDPLRGPAEDLLRAAEVAIERFPFIDGSRQAAAGASYGGHLVNWLQGTTDHYKSLVGHAGLIDLEGQYSSSDSIFHREIMNGGPAWEKPELWRDQSPSSYVGNFSTPILLTIGEKDYRVPVNQTIAAWSYVQRMQVPGKLLVFHDANHWIMNGEEARYFWQEVHDWLARYF